MYFYYFSHDFLHQFTIFSRSDGRTRSNLGSDNKDPTLDRKVMFEEAITIIECVRVNAFTAVNRELITMYWNIGEYVSEKTRSDDWVNLLYWNSQDTSNHTS